MKTFLLGLGFSQFEVKKLIENFGNLTLNKFETPEGRDELASVVEKSSVRACHMQYTRIWNGDHVYSLLEPFEVPSEPVYRFFCSCGGDDVSNFDARVIAEEKLKESPYELVLDCSAPFPAVDEAAKAWDWTQDQEKRVKAAVYYVLSLAEKGTEDVGRDKFSRLIGDVSGSTCLPIGKLISLSEILLKDTATADEIESAARALHKEKKILLTKKEIGGDLVLVAYRAKTAKIEIDSAKMIKERLDLTLSSPIVYTNEWEAVDKSQATLGLYLSHEQSEAAMQALTNRISVITGGPGTGKTQTLKVLIETYRRLSGGKPVTLMAPTGQAAKRMTESSGYMATTIHIALGITPGEMDIRVAKELPAGLIVIDESSMLDAQMLFMLLSKMPKDAIVVFIGDANQLPSIGAGCVLEELTKCVPVATLTKIFRQDGDAADIAYNAARIKAGTTQMIEGAHFSFIEKEGSAEIQKAVCEIYKEEAEKHGVENVVVLSPLRRNTKTGVNQLNTALRKEISDEKRYLTSGDIKLYQKDKIVFLRNRLGLVNGEIGCIEEIKGDSAICSFGGKQITLSGSELSWIMPAYAETIHKSQGDEYPVVILVSDPMHRSTKAMTYTAITRARDKVLVVGSKAAFEETITSSTQGRFSCLSTLVNS